MCLLLARGVDPTQGSFLASPTQSLIKIAQAKKRRGSTWNAAIRAI
jgi:hypothetical protein